MGRKRNLAILVGLAGLTLALFLALLLHPTLSNAAEQAPSGHYVGVASCAGSTCHGRSEADGPVVRQDEILTWQNESSPSGAHSRAWRVLQEPRAQMIARRLGIAEAANAPECLGCHATPVQGAERGPRFLVSDGVGCESCHGPASGWLSSHYAVGGTHASNVARGMIPLENPEARAAVCLDCHFGSAEPDRFVTHRIMAAGHPRIAFELDLFSTLQQHHDVDADYIQRKGRPSSLQIWAVGQAMAVDRSLALFTNPARGTEGVFPEFYFFDCHTCHRRISDSPSFEPSAVANPGRPIPTGMPAYNDENMIMLSAAARVVAPAMAQRFDADSRAFHAAIDRDRSAAVAAGQRLRESAQALADAFARANMDRTQAFAIIDAITSEAVSPRFTDYEGSVQAVMATDTLLSSLVSSGAVSEGAANAVRGDINLAYQAVRDPNAYQPAAFRTNLGRAAAAIRGLR